MEPTTITGIILTIVAVISLLIAWHQYRLNHSQRMDSKLGDLIDQIVHRVTEPLKEAVGSHSAQLNQQGDRLSRIESLIKDNTTDVRGISDKLSQMGVKVDLYWATLESLAMNAAKGLHQPDPARARIDHLLEAFVEGTLTPGERTELKKVLVKIRNYEPSGPPLEFPVHPGEQTFAAILLSTMDIVDPGRIAALGHTMHRSARDKENRTSGQ